MRRAISSSNWKKAPSTTSLHFREVCQSLENEVAINDCENNVGMQLAERDRMIEELVAEVTQQRKQNSELNVAYNDALGRLRGLVVDQSAKDVEGNAAEVRLQEALDELRRCQLARESEKNDQTKALIDAHTTKDVALERCKTLEERLLGISLKVKEKGSKSAEMKGKYKKAKELLREKDARIASMESYVSTLPTLDSWNSLQLELSSTRAANCDLGTSLEKCRADLASCKTDCAMFENKALMYEGQIAELNAEVSQLKHALGYDLPNEAKLNDLTPDDQIRKLQRTCRELKASKEANEQKADISFKQLKLVEKRAHEESSQLQLKLQEKDNDISSLRTELQRAHILLDGLSNDIRELQHQKQALQLTMAEQRDELADFESIVSGDAAALFEDVFEELKSSVDLIVRLRHCIEGLVCSAAGNTDVLTKMVNSFDLEILFSTSQPIIVLAGLEDIEKLNQLRTYVADARKTLDGTLHMILQQMAIIQGQLLPLS